MDPHQFMLVVVAQARRLDSCALVQRGVVQEAGACFLFFFFFLCPKRKQNSQTKTHLAPRHCKEALTVSERGCGGMWNASVLVSGSGLEAQQAQPVEGDVEDNGQEEEHAKQHQQHVGALPPLQFREQAVRCAY